LNKSLTNNGNSVLTTLRVFVWQCWYFWSYWNRSITLLLLFIFVAKQVRDLILPTHTHTQHAAVSYLKSFKNITRTTSIVVCDIRPWKIDIFTLY